MRIGELADRTGTSVRSLRYYEQQGLLRPARTPSGQRVYEADAVERVAQIVRLLRAGLGTATIADLLPCFDAPPHERTGYLLDSLEAERARIDSSIEAMTAVRTSLSVVIDAVTAERESAPST